METEKKPTSLAAFTICGALATSITAAVAGTWSHASTALCLANGLFVGGAFALVYGALYIAIVDFLFWRYLVFIRGAAPILKILAGSAFVLFIVGLLVVGLAVPRPTARYGLLWDWPLSQLAHTGFRPPVNK